MGLKGFRVWGLRGLGFIGFRVLGSGLAFRGLGVVGMSYTTTLSKGDRNVGALGIRIGVWGRLYYSCSKEPLE